MVFRLAERSMECCLRWTSPVTQKRLEPSRTSIVNTAGERRSSVYVFSPAFRGDRKFRPPREFILVTAKPASVISRYETNGRGFCRMSRPAAARTREGYGFRRSHSHDRGWGIELSNFRSTI